jgi:hypothetical protein
MTDEDFEAWKICWQVNIAFHIPIQQPQTCIVCSQVLEYGNGIRRSVFWLDGTRCSAGHGQAKREEVEGAVGLGVCGTCDQTYTLDVVMGKIKCRRTPCRRTVRVHKAEVQRVLNHPLDENPHNEHLHNEHLLM